MVSEKAKDLDPHCLQKSLYLFLHIVSAKLVVVWCLSVDTTVLSYYIHFSPHALTFVYSKELERDVTATAMAKALLRLKSLAKFLHRT